MNNCFKIGRIAIILNGKHAGKKGIVIENKIKNEKKNTDNIIILGIKNIPRKINQKRNDKKKKINIKVFFKALNKSHVLPTRYFVDLNPDQQKLISNVSKCFFQNKAHIKPDNSPTDLWKVDNIFIDKYFSGKNKWFFKKLKF